MTRAIRMFIACSLVIMLPACIFANDNGFGVIYDGGSLQAKSGTNLKLYIEPTQFRFTKDKADLLTVPAGAITEVSYGQDVHRRVGASIGLALVSFGIGALMMFSKSKKHYVGVTWANGDQKGGFAIQCDKKEYRGILAGLEGISGKKAIDSTTLTVKN
jgi:hypothetical protein